MVLVTEWTDNKDNMIKLANLSKRFLTAGQSVTVLKNINLTIRRGEIFGVIGRSGAGKSTLVRCMNFLEMPEEGDVLIDGTRLADLNKKQLRKARHQIGMIFQHFNLLSSRTVAENIALPLELQGVSKKQITKKVAELISLVELNDKKNDYPSQLSGGQKQRVAIARALATDPAILLSDEATSALDPETTRSILALLKKINHELGLTIVLITHEMDVVKQICHRVAVMEQGEIVEENTVIDIFSQPKSPITQRLTQTSLRLDLPHELQQKMKSTSFSGGHPIVRLAFIGQQASKPLISTLVKNFSVEASILEADLELIQDALVGICVCHLIGEENNIQQALSYLNDHQIKIEVMGYV